MVGEDRAKGGGGGVLEGLNLAVGFDGTGVGGGGFGLVQGDELVGEGFDGEAFPGVAAPAPEGLEGGPVGGSFADLEGDDFGVEDVGHDLAPDLGFGTAAGGANLGGLDAEFGEAAESVVHAEGDAFHGGAGEVRGGEGLGGDAEEDAGAGRDVGRAFAVEVGDEHEAVGAGGDGSGGGGEFVVGPAEILAGHLGGDGDVHGAEEGEPAVGGVAKGGDLTAGVDDGFGGAGVDGAAGAEAGGDDAGAGVAGADGTHHVVAAAGADEDVGAEAEGLGGGGLEVAGGLVAGAKRGKLGGKVGVDGGEGGGGPLAFADVEEGGAAGVAVFHGGLAGEPVVEVVVGQEDGGEAGEVFRLVAFEPENLGGGEAGGDGVADGFDGGLESAEVAGDLLALRNGGGVAPEFGGADDLALFVEGDEAVLLAADPDGLDFGGGGAGVAEGLADGLGGGVAPGVGMLLLGAGGEVGEEIVGGGGAGENLAIAGVHDENLGGLGAAVDAENEGAHGVRRSECFVVWARRMNKGWGSVQTFCSAARGEKGSGIAVVEMAGWVGQSGRHMSKRFYLTTAIDYVNGQPHLGHAYEKIIADVIARSRRCLGEEVFFLTGLDEHGQKVQQAAIHDGKSPQAYCDDLAAIWGRFAGKLQLTNDDFVRTTDARHKDVVRAVLAKLERAGHFYKAAYKGFYSTKEETFLTEKDRRPDGTFDPSYGEVVELVEENYYFRLKDQQQWLIDYIEANPEFIAPSYRRNEVLGFLKNNALEDLCITRPAARLNWGIPVPFDPGYVTYVWFDALVNYISVPAARGDGAVLGALGQAAPDGGTAVELWPADVHVIGKDILKFHGVYWPIMLKVAGLPLPRQLLVHGWWQKDGAKMSKTTGNVVDPVAVIDDWGLDAFRFYVLRELDIGPDGNWTDAGFQGRYQAELANGLGNLVNRSLSMLKRYRGGVVPARSDELAADAGRAVAATVGHLRAYELQGALVSVWQLVTRANQYVDQTAPFKLAKDPAQAGRLDEVLYNLAESCRVLAVLLQPFLPGTSAKIFEQLGLPAGTVPLAAAAWGGLQAGKTIGEPAALFPRRDGVKK